MRKSCNHYNIEKRTTISKVNHAIDKIDFSNITDLNLRCSLELQKHFGLRREECLKINPSQADKTTRLWLKDSWTKGKVERFIPIKTEEQRHWLDVAKRIANKDSLIPKNKMYIDQLKKYNSVIKENNFKRLHGLRYNYAQKRYYEITGFKCKFAGGKDRIKMNNDEKIIDKTARLIISNELGHSRINVTNIYIG
jgi:hypothetical protein